MDDFLRVSRPSSVLRATTKRDSAGLNFNPYAKKQTSTTAPSTTAMNKYLMSSLKDRSERNPITQGDAPDRAEHLTSTASGHQVAEGRKQRKLYFDGKLDEKQLSTKSKILFGVRLYIDGFMNDYTYIEVKQQVVLNGGQIMPSASGATHIVASQAPSANRTMKRVHIVRPDWIYESIAAGKRKSERQYGLNPSPLHMFQVK